MPINLQGSGNITEGWAPPPQLHAAPVGELVSSILKDRLLREKMMQENIAEAIKQAQQQRAAGAYLEAARKSGVLPGDALQGVDSSAAGLYGKTLADQYREMKEAEVNKTYKEKLINAMYGQGKGGGGRGGGGGGGEPDYDYSSPEFEAQYPATKTVNGIEMYRRLDAKGRVNYVPFNVPLQSTTTRDLGVKDTYQVERDKEKAIDNLQVWRKIQELEDIEKGKTDPAFRNRPFAQQAKEDQLRKDIEELRHQRENPPPAADTGQGQTTMPPQKFGSEQAARAAGYQSGDTVYILDPATKQYRPAILED